MEKNYYEIPQSFSAIIKGKTPEKTTIEISVKQHLNLLVMNRVGSFRYDENYGSIILEKDFESTIYTSPAAWCQSIETQLSEVVKKYEKRLSEDSISLNVEEYKSDGSNEKSIQITIKGTLLDYWNSPLEIKFLMNVSPILSLTVL
jgi:predicted component of type VI protein secretion system